MAGGSLSVSDSVGREWVGVAGGVLWPPSLSFCCDEAAQLVLGPPRLKTAEREILKVKDMVSRDRCFGVVSGVASVARSFISALWRREERADAIITRSEGGGTRLVVSLVNMSARCVQLLLCPLQVSQTRSE